MNAFSTRHEAGNTRGASRARSEGKGNKLAFKRILQRYADLVICPRMTQHASAGALNAQRLVAAQQVILTDPSYALDIYQMAGTAPRELPFRFTALDAWRIAVDEMHARKAVAV